MNTRNKTIWVIDDDESILEVIQIILAEEGYNIQVINNGNALIEKLTSEQPDIILIDILMSGTNGADVAKDLKADRKTTHIPIIMMSADIKGEDKAHQAGADGYLKKPFNIDELLEKINTYTK